MKPKDIKTQFTKHVKNAMNSDNPKFELWYCGITNNEKRREAEHNAKKGIVEFWKCENAKKKDNANEIEQYYHFKGTKNSPHTHGAIETSKWVFIFKMPVQRPSSLSGVFDVENIFKELFEE